MSNQRKGGKDPPEKAPSFEEAFDRLTQVVQTLENGGLTLEESTRLFQEGMRLAELCTQKLTQAELKVTQLKSAYLEHIGGEAPSREESGEG